MNHIVCSKRYTTYPFLLTHAKRYKELRTSVFIQISTTSILLPQLFSAFVYLSVQSARTIRFKRHLPNIHNVK